MRNPEALAPGLYVTSTPIGNARDITLRALEVLRGCDLIVAEDTRVTAKLLAIYGVTKSLVAYNDHNAPRERPRLLARLKSGDRLALVSDAGTPLISDPGYKLVRDAIAMGHAVQAIPGPSALLAAMVLAGLPTDRFLFAGFLPSRAGERRRVICDLSSVPATIVFFESAARLGQALSDMADLLGARRAAVTRELTKLHEEVRRDDLCTLARIYMQAPVPKGEITIVVAPPTKTEQDFRKAEGLLQKAMAHMPLSSAADLVSDALSLPRRAVYERALALRSGKNEKLKQ